MTHQIGRAATRQAGLTRSPATARTEAAGGSGTSPEGRASGSDRPPAAISLALTLPPTINKMWRLIEMESGE